MVIHELEEVKVEEEEDKKQKVCRTQRRFYGLYNQGSTCYLNSVLQVLFMTPELHDKFETSETITKQRKLDPQLQTIDEELWNLFKLLEKTICKTESLTKILHITNVHEQCDAAECLEKILNQISSQASEIFQGILRNTTKCFDNHSIIEDSDPFWTLPVSLKDSSDSVVSVKGAFEMIFQPTAFSEDNMVHCSECRTKTEAMSVYEMEKSPQILILLLKRFDFDYYFMSYVKSDCQVDVPRTLQMKEKEYELYGIVHHMGSLRFGHYTATILSSEDNTWYKFNDSYVSKAEEQLFKQTDNYTSRTAYLLVYRASGCPGVEVRDDQELESEKEVDVGHEKEEPINNEMEDSAPDPQQNLSGLPEMNPGDESGLEDGEITNYDSAPAEIPPHQMNTNRCLDNKPTSDHVVASGCPGVEVRDDHRVEQELESEKDVDVGHEKEEPIIQEMEDSAPDPQQNPSDLPEMNPGDECGVKEEGVEVRDDHQDEQEFEAEKEVDAELKKDEPTNNEMEDSAPDPQQNLSDLPELNPEDEYGIKEEDGEISSDSDSVHSPEIPPHQMKTDRCLDKEPTSVHVEASGCPGVEVRDDHQVEQELESEKDFDAEHGKEEPINTEMEDSAPNPQQNLSDLPEMNPGGECGVKEEGLQDGDISSNYDSAPAEIPPHQMNTDRCLDNKPTSVHVEASGCPGVEMRDDHQVEQELEAEKEVDAELKKDEPTNNEMEDSARDPQQNPGVLSEMKPCGVKDEGLEDGEITNYDSAPAEIPPHQMNTDRCLDNKPTSDHVEASGCPGVEVRDNHRVEQELESEKEVDAEHEKEEPINNEMEDSAPDPQQNPSDLPEMNPGDECGIKEEGPKDEEISNVDSAPAEIPLHQITLESEKKADAEHGKEECSVIIDMMEYSPLNLQKNPSEPCVGVKDEGLQDQEISSNYDSAPAEIPLHEMNTDRCEPTSVHVEASGCPGVEVRDDHQDEEEFEAEKEVDVEHEKEEPINAEMEDSAPDPQQNPGVLSEMKSCVIKEEGLEDGEITNYDSAPAEIPPHQMNTDRCLDKEPTSVHVVASGCPGVEVRDDHRVEQELESEKDVDAEHGKEEPINTEMEDSAPDPQQNLSDLPEMNPGGECGVKEEGLQDGDISNYDSAPAEIPPHQMNTDRCEPTSVHVEASGCPGVEMRDDHGVEQELEAEKEVDAEHEKEEPIIQEMEDSAPNPQQNPSDLPEMNPGDECGVKEEGAKDEEISNIDSAPAEIPLHQITLESEKKADAEHGKEECSVIIDMMEYSPLNLQQNPSEPCVVLEMKPWGVKEEGFDSAPCQEDEVRHDPGNEEELESEKNVDAEHGMEECSITIDEDSPLNPLQNLQERKPWRKKEEDEDFPKSSRSPLRRRCTIPTIPLWVLFVFLLFLLILLLLFLSFLLL